MRRGQAREADAVDRGHGRDLERLPGHTGAQEAMEGVEQRDVLVVRVGRVEIADPVDLDPGEIAA